MRSSSVLLALMFVCAPTPVFAEEGFEAHRPVPPPPPDPHAYTDLPQLRFAPAAGAEFGLGTTFPTLRTPAFELEGKLGISIRTGTDVSIVLAGQSGVTLAFNTGNATPFYGYFIRIPLEFAPEVIYSRILDYHRLRYINLHFGGAVGGDLLLAAQCVAPDCNYIQPAIGFGLGARIGISYSAVERSSIGVFVDWHNYWASCAQGATCLNYLSSLVWSLGWTLF